MTSFFSSEDQTRLKVLYGDECIAYRNAVRRLGRADVDRVLALVDSL